MALRLLALARALLTSNQLLAARAYTALATNSPSFSSLLLRLTEKYRLDRHLATIIDRNLAWQQPFKRLLEKGKSSLRR
jgi:hypothetical protein